MANETPPCRVCGSPEKVICFPDDHAQTVCPDCSDSGRTPGVAEALFRSQPVTEVRLSDREPVPIHLSGGYRPLSWHSITGRQDSGYLDPDLFAAVLEEGSWENHGPGPVVGYDTAGAAHAALSAAACRLGRTRAGVG